MPFFVKDHRTTEDQVVQLSDLIISQCPACGHEWSSQCPFCLQALESASQARLTALRVHEALINAQVPGYLDAYPSTLGGIAGLEDLRRELQGLIDGKLRKSR